MAELNKYMRVAYSWFVDFEKEFYDFIIRRFDGKSLIYFRDYEFVDMLHVWGDD